MPIDTPSVARGPWDGFLVGPENALAHAAAVAVARGEAQGITPLIFHGPSGVGKSRLLEGLVDDRLRRSPDAAVALISGGEFLSPFDEHADPTDAADRHDRLRSLDLLALDDVDGLRRFPSAITALIPILDALADTGAAIVVAAKSGPGHWEGWPRRLTNRLSSGLSLRLEPPGPETRRRFLWERASARGLTLTAGAVDSLSEATETYATLEGWLTQIQESDRLRRAGTTPIGAGDLIDASRVPQARALDELTREVAARFGLTPNVIRGQSQRAVVSLPRQLAMWLAHREGGVGIGALGRYFGKRDPATVRHAIRTIARKVAEDPELAGTVEAISSAWRRSGATRVS